MALYAWKGLDGKGKPIAGTREADGPKGLRQVLRREGIFLTSVREALAGEKGNGSAAAREAGGSGGGARSGLRREVDLGYLLERIRPQDVAVFTRQVATLLTAGIPLAEALGALTEQVDNRKLQMILAGIRQRVNEGDSLADAMKAHPRVFPELYTNMVRSGEVAGNLDAVLARLADFLDAQIQLRAKISGAMTYPVVMTVVGTGIMGFLMVSVVPKITSVFEDVERALPWNTRLLITLADVASNYWWALILGAVAVGLLFKRWKRSGRGRLVVDRAELKMPLVGPLLRHVAVARFSRTLSTLLASGVPVLTALEIVKKVLSNVVLEKVVDEARDAIREGESIAAPFKRSGQFPSMMCHMVAVGERSGQLESMLQNVAAAYEREVDVKVSRLTTLLSPVMILGMAIGVGFVVFSVLQPILAMQEFVQ